MESGGRRTVSPVMLGGSLSLALTLVLLWPALGTGNLLFRDFVSVPDPVLSPAVWGWGDGAPRAVPLDPLMAILDPVVDSGVQQQVLLLSALFLSGSGLAFLLRRRGPAAAATGAALGTWNTYAVERLLIGQPPTLLAWSMLPWIVAAARSRATGTRWLLGVVAAAAPAALTPYGGVLAIAVAVGVVWIDRGGVRRLLAVAAAGALWCSVWLVPAVVGRSEAGQAQGAPAFAVEAAGLTGILDVVGGGGLWSDAATPPSRAAVLSVALSAILALAAWFGLAQLTRRHRRALRASLVVPPVLALGLATGPGLAVLTSLQAVPGVAIFRDTHRLLGVSWFAVSVGCALLAGAAARRYWAGRHLVRGVLASATVLLVTAISVLSVPDAAALLHQAYRPHSFPDEFERVREVVGDDPVLILPWEPLRRADWALGSVFLDPYRLALPGRVVSARRLTVVRPQGTFTVGPSESPAVLRLLEDPVSGDRLEEAGLVHVIEWMSPGQTPRIGPDLRLTFAGPHWRVWTR